MLVPQHRRHHPRGCRVERGAEIEAGFHPGRTLNRSFGQSQVDLLQGDGQPAVGVDGESQGEFRRDADLRVLLVVADT